MFQSDKNISSPVLNKELGNSSTNAIYKKNPGVIPGFDISVATFRNFVDFEDLIGEDATLIVQPKKRKRHSSWRKKPTRLVKAV